MNANDSTRVTTAGLVLVLGLAGCQDAPLEPAAPPNVVTPAVVPEDWTRLLAALEDARSRIVPALGDGRDVEALGAALGELQGAVSQRAAALPVEALGRARAAVAKLRRDESLGPDLDVVLLVLEQLGPGAGGPADSRLSGTACAAGVRPDRSVQVTTRCEPLEPRREP